MFSNINNLKLNKVKKYKSKYIGILDWLEKEYVQFTKSAVSDGTVNLDDKEIIDMDEWIYMPKSENIMRQRMLNLRNKYD